jgi:Zeta toxin
MSKRETTDAAVLDRPAEPVRADRPKAVFAVGRGGRGKTVAYRWMIDRGLNRGRQMIVADGDRTNMTLAAFFPGLVADNPTTGADEDMRAWLDALLERAISGRQSLLVDLGGGDQLLKQAALELDLIGFLAQNGMEPVVLHFIGADLDDLAYLREVERDRLLAPEKTAIIFNTGVVPAGVSADAAWQKHERDPALVAAVDRGAQLIRMPRLGCMTKLDDGRLRFTEATAAKIGLMDAQRVLIWLREMERAFEPIAGWLP